MASPPPQAQPPASPISPTPDANSKANALLKSMVDSIQQTQDRPSTPEATSVGAASFPNADMSPNSRRKRDLAQALFGKEEEEQQEHPKPEGDIAYIFEQPQAPITINADPFSSHNPITSSSSNAPYILTRNPSMPRVPPTPQEAARLAQEVQQKTSAATLALKKPSINANLSADPYGPNGSPSRKRISPNQISTPRLVSSSTSVEAVPIPRAPSLSSTNNSGPSRIGSRFKKLRGSLRSKNLLPTGDETTLSSDHRVSGGTVSASVIETSFKVPVLSPPAAGGPGLKGFMARLRGKQRIPPDTASESDTRRSPLLSSTSTSTQRDKTLMQTPQSSKPIQSASSVSTLRAPPQTRSAPATQVSHDFTDIATPSESTALQQLFDAANNLGLDQEALNDLLARSPSTSSRTTEWTMLTRNNSTLGAAATTLVDSSRSTPTAGQPSTENQSLRAETPDPKTNEHVNGRHNIDSPSPRDESVSGQPFVRKTVGHPRRQREGQSDRATSAIIRRTIIYPSESRASPIDISAVTRKNSNRRKRTSASSISTRSVHDRVPTPPPPKSPTSKRFSNGPSPPVPNLPHSLTPHTDNLLTVPSSLSSTLVGPIEKSSSTYDSL